MKHSKDDLFQMQSLPLESKIIMTKQRIKVWYDNWHKFEIIDNKNRNKPTTRYVTMDVRDCKEPKLKETEYINREYDGQVYVSFSGGKDSTVLLHMVREMYPDVEAVFTNTGLEYPEIQKFVKTFDNVTILRPEMRFDEVIKKYGYPMISKEVSHKISGARKGANWAKKFVYGTAVSSDGKKSRYCVDKYEPLVRTDFNVSNKCCDVMKKKPLKRFTKQTGKVPITAQLASESMLRTQQWIKNGCNMFDAERPISNPMSFWTEQDVLKYIYKYNVKIADVYGDVIFKDGQLTLDGTGKLETTGCDRTGCIFCGFGCHLEKGKSRFERLKETHPKQYNYCLNGGEYDKNGIWKPNKQGLGMKHVFDELNKLYGDGFIKY